MSRYKTNYVSFATAPFIFNTVGVPPLTIFCQLPNINSALNGSVLEEYLPWADQVQLECKINTEETNLKEENSSESA